MHTVQPVNLILQSISYFLNTNDAVTVSSAIESNNIFAWPFKNENFFHAKLKCVYLWMGEKTRNLPRAMKETLEVESVVAIHIAQHKLDSTLTKPDTSLTLSCDGLTHIVKFKQKKSKSISEKTILNKVSAIIRPGRLTAVMGASGAGKTTLLNMLAGVSQYSNASSGYIRVNGQTIGEHGLKMSDISGYVYQDDVILDTMTVRESLKMSAILRLPKDIDHEERIDDLLEILGLESCQNTLIGSSMVKGISGGERKRVSVAMEMITNPAILFLDEPTSGLDTFTAFNMMSTLVKLAHEQERTIVATIHQPSSEIFHLFDDVLLLAEGRVIYYGPADQVISYFGSRGYPCPQYTNPADYIFMEVLNTTGADKEMCQKRIEKMLNSWEDSEELGKLMSELHSMPATDISATALRQSASFLTQLRYLLGRAFKNVLRNKMIVQVKIIQSVFIGILISIIYWDTPSKPFQSQIQDRIGALFFIVFNQFMGSAMGVLSAFSQERAVFLREYAQGYYSLSPYYLAKISIEMPFQVLSPLLMVIICYFPIGFQTNFLKLVILLADGILIALCGKGLGILAASSFSNIGIALAVLPTIILPLMLFSGLYVNTASIPAWLAWIKYISPSFYAFNAAAKNEFTGLTFPDCPAPYPSPCSGNIALNQLGIQDGPTIWESFLVLLVMYMTLIAAGYLALWFISRAKKSS